MEEQINSRRELEAQLHSKETQKMEEFRSKVSLFFYTLETSYQFFDAQNKF